ncbi:3-hydroxybenzoate 6-hydroxylase [Lecanosticta acicola]|uniref:3-hydroxybenzoate 6-hydroxylase n=1 Tax=Lecanosticta acicola TaxID=111012 RepID=A0AAI8YRW9_9PEZI|nr:3-hydroxybenzoate 6-hydroxylase [Lecanosticta acicola]
MTDVAHHSTPSKSILVAPHKNGQSLSVNTVPSVTQAGSYEFDRIIRAGELLKRRRKTKSWKPIYIVLRPNLLSIYKDKQESKLRHQINLSELTAVARQKDSKRREKHVFALFSPSRNYHLEAHSDKEAQEWVECIRREAGMDEHEEEFELASPGGAYTPYSGFERSIDANISPSADERAAGYSSSDADAFFPSQSLPKTRDRRSTNMSANRRTSQLEYSGADHGSYSDFSDCFPARMSALSLAHTDGRPSTSSTQTPQVGSLPASSIYGQTPIRPSIGIRNPSQMSGLALGADGKQSSVASDERIVCHGWIYLLKSTSGVRQWKKVWMVLRPKQLAIYKNDEEYTAQIIMPFASIIDVVEVDPISKSKVSCMQIISEERNYRFCATDEESLTKWLGAFKSLLCRTGRPERYESYCSVLEPPSKQNPLNVGLCGAGIGGLAAAIAIARAGCNVTVLEAAAELGEIGAGIQMTPNVSRLLIKWGVADIIGDDLVQCKYINMRRKDGEVVQRTELHPKVVREFGFPWWMVHRHHLHTGLAEGARRHGVKIITDARVTNINDATTPVQVQTYKGDTYTFDLLIGSDGLKSVARKHLFPEVVPRAPTNNAAYRAVLPYEYVYSHAPLARDFGNDIDVWAYEKGYVIMYPISAGKDWNAVMSHYRDVPVTDVEDNCSMEEMVEYFKDIDPRLLQILRLVKESKRWPLLVTGPLESWSNAQRNVVLMGDAAHSMVNHLAQGAATSMEDGAFLGRVLGEVVHNVLTLPEAMDLYEKTRMPRAWAKQQASFIMGGIYMAEEDARGNARDASSRASVRQTTAMEEVRNLDSKRAITGPDANSKSWNLWGAPETVQSIFSYDAEGDADFAVIRYLQETRPWDRVTGVSSGLERKWTGWYLPEEEVGRIARSRGVKL